MDTNALREVGELNSTLTDEQQKRLEHLYRCHLFIQKVNKWGRQPALWNQNPKLVLRVKRTRTESSLCERP
ncbi:hypothetical protein HPT25_23000 [Bacillus sp. BRMEA1]|uniref:hypothetical protein n=1 Tax=Neobacillus endophyticus TaxID=2738405 RepID=UPI00156645DA|nr:hypothetical protein [Neobacillus endophyticus]NRD80203.1 hypothetical protein [Neobacillus endophyticus]